MRSPLGLLFEREEELREPEEIDALEEALVALGHRVDRVGTLDALLERFRQGTLPGFVWNISVRALSRNRPLLVPALLETLRIPYVGADASARGLTLNRDALKPLMRQLKVPTPAWRRFREIADVIALPPWEVSVLKPAYRGGSAGLEVFRREEGLEALQQRVATLLQQFDGAVLCEQLIVGREISVGLVANATSPVSCAAEALLADGAARSRSFQQVVPAPADPAVQEATLLSRSVATFLGPLDYATFTFRIESEDTPYLIDVDLDASLHPQHTLARAFALGGIEYPKMIKLILEASLQRWGRSDSAQ